VAALVGKALIIQAWNPFEYQYDIAARPYSVKSGYPFSPVDFNEAINCIFVFLL
jgi:hypothetical protein